MQLTQIAKNFGGFVMKNSTTILTYAAVGGLITTAVLTGEGTIKAVSLMDDAEIKKNPNIKQGGEKWEKLTFKEQVQTCWKCYIPAVAVGATSIACIIGSNHIHTRRYAALAGLYSLTETAFKEYKDKAVEALGSKKELAIRDDISADHAKKSQEKSGEIIFTGKGEVLCYDCHSGRTFKSDIENVKHAVNELNAELLRSGAFIPLNDLYYALGLADIDLGNLMGWQAPNDIIQMQYTSLLNVNNEPCLALKYNLIPKYR